MSKSRPDPRLSNRRQAEEHLRLMIDPRFLGTATALIVVCDRDGRPAAHLHLVECDLAATPSQCTSVLDLALEAVADGGVPDVSGLSLGLTRPGGEQVQPYDRSWFRALYRVCHGRGLTAHGVYVVSRHGARAVHIDDAA